ncbi:MAG: polysaccharide export protein [Polyangiaceae bacterium]|nr:polysaccharide export protein [Myxococcales bacterium]MCB9591021.1 polysaccharide export protein [Polyangiaceae bacterium]MCB9605184.1 polysaccharide export protein [Polyangiaceae bacterium]
MRPVASISSHMRPLVVWLFCVSLFFVGCGSSGPAVRGTLPPVEESSQLGPGDVFKMQIVGEKDLPEEYQIASDGTVALPYLERLEVGGLEPQEVAKLVTKELKGRKILQKPVVIVRVEAYNSRKVTVLGEVQKPGSFPYQPGLTLIQAVSQAGGFNSIAKLDQLRLTRQRKKGGDVTVVVSAEAITEGTAPDIPLQAGDRIYVPQRVF